VKTARLSEVDATVADADHFAGRVTRHDLIMAVDPPSSAILVRFEPGGRTHWHRHPGGQYLYVLEGRGVAQARGGDQVELRPGDCLYARPGEEHWHGASEDDGLAHLAFSFGLTEWVGPVDPD
jgi:quercetin dioxygenase-like cupin family protein